MDYLRTHARALILGVTTILAAVASFAQAPEPYVPPSVTPITDAISTGVSSFITSFGTLFASVLPVVIGVGLIVLVVGWMYRATLGKLLSGGILGGGKE